MGGVSDAETPLSFFGFADKVCKMSKLLFVFI